MKTTTIAALLYFSMLMVFMTGLGAATGINASLPVEHNASCNIGMAEDNGSVLAVQFPDIAVADTPEKKHAIFLAAQSYALNNSMVDFRNFYGQREDLFDAQLDQTINILRAFMAMGIADDRSPARAKQLPAWRASKSCLNEKKLRMEAESPRPILFIIRKKYRRQLARVFKAMLEIRIG